MLTSQIKHEKLRSFENPGDDWAGYGHGMNEDSVELEDSSRSHCEQKHLPNSVLNGTHDLIKSIEQGWSNRRAA